MIFPETSKYEKLNFEFGRMAQIRDKLRSIENLKDWVDKNETAVKSL